MFIYQNDSGQTPILWDLCSLVNVCKRIVRTSAHHSVSILRDQIAPWGLPQPDLAYKLLDSAGESGGQGGRFSVLIGGGDIWSGSAAQRGEKMVLPGFGPSNWNPLETILQKNEALCSLSVQPSSCVKHGASPPPPPTVTCWLQVLA